MNTFGRTSPRRARAAACATCLLLCALTSYGSTLTQTRTHARRQKPSAQSVAPGAPVSLGELLKSLGARGPKSARLVKDLEARGVSFETTPETEAQLVKAGARPEVIAAARSNYRPAAPQKDSASAAPAPAIVTLPLPVTLDPTDNTLSVPRPMPTPEDMSRGGGMAVGPGMGMGSGTPSGAGSGVGVGNGTGYAAGRGYNTGGGDSGGAGGETGYSRVFKPAEVSRKAVITVKPAPGFTEEARKNNVEGTVRLRAILSASGSVQGISVVKGLPDGLTEKAIAAAKQIRFTPAQKDGRTVSQYVTLEYNFNFYYDEGDVTKRAVILEMPAPEYTAEARGNRVSGKVVLKVFLLKGGGVSIASVEQSLPDGLTLKAMEAARRIKFTPAEKDGRAVTQLTTIEYVFKP